MEVVSTVAGFLLAREGARGRSFSSLVLVAARTSTMRALTVLTVCGQGRLLLLAGMRKGVLLPGVLLLGEALGVLLWSLLLRLDKGRILWRGCQLLIRSVLGLGLLVATLEGQARRVRLGLRVLP